MLVLGRKRNEAICINDNIVVTVLGIRGKRVRIGVEAPREMPVYRSVVHVILPPDTEDQTALDTNGEEQSPRRRFRR